MHSHRHAAKAAASDKLRRMTSDAGAPKGDGMGLSADAPDYHDGRFGDDGLMDTSGKRIETQRVPTRKRGGRVEGKEPKARLDRPARKNGGRVSKGKTTVNIIMGGDKPSQPVPVPVPAGGAPQMPPPRPQMPPQAMPVAMPMAAGPMGGPQMPPPGPMPRKRGGRVAGLSVKDGGAGSGEGRLAKAAMQKRVK